MFAAELRLFDASDLRRAHARDFVRGNRHADAAAADQHAEFAAPISDVMPDFAGVIGDKLSTAKVEWKAPEKPSTVSDASVHAFFKSTAQKQDASTKGRYWMLRVAADPRAIGGGSRLTVTGYVLPPASSSAGGAAPPPKEAVVVTSANRALFGEVQAAGRWIQDEAFRNRKRGR